MSTLLDVNVLVALAWPNHIHHQAAVAWFEANHASGWATCPLTQSGFVRVSSNHRVIPGARTPAQAIVVLRRLTEIPGHEFWADEVSIASDPNVHADHVVGHRQVTDAHLVALALRNEARLATFDATMAEVLPPGAETRESILLLSGS